MKGEVSSHVCQVQLMQIHEGKRISSLFLNEKEGCGSVYSCIGDDLSVVT